MARYGAVDAAMAAFRAAAGPVFSDCTNTCNLASPCDASLAVAAVPSVEASSTNTTSPTSGSLSADATAGPIVRLALRAAIITHTGDVLAL
jgi:hypothetical protein